MKKLHVPADEAELTFLRALLEQHDIPYFVHNEHFASLSVGPRVPLLNRRTVMVDEVDLERAREVLAGHLELRPDGR